MPGQKDHGAYSEQSGVHFSSSVPSGVRRARGQVLHPSRVERRAPAPLVVPRELEIVALAGHADRDVANAGPGIEQNLAATDSGTPP